MKKIRIKHHVVGRAIALLFSALMFPACGQQSAASEDAPLVTAQKPAPEEPCAAADSQAAMARCWGEEATAAEQRSAAARDKVLDWLQERQQDDVAKMFREAHTRWESYRDAQCESVAAVYQGGSIAALQRAQCRRRLAEARTRELDEMMSDANN
jgi:uncharacterized protein YecT (DUF1311 family)